jgi:hypothetical protein
MSANGRWTGEVYSASDLKTEGFAKRDIHGLGAAYLECGKRPPDSVERYGRSAPSEMKRIVRVGRSNPWKIDPRSPGNGRSGTRGKDTAEGFSIEE